MKHLYLALLLACFALGCSDGEGGDEDAADGTDVPDTVPDPSQDPLPDTLPDGDDPAPDPAVDPVPDPVDDDAPPPEGHVIAGCRIFPADNMWNTAIDSTPLHDRSADYIASIGADTGLHCDFGTVWEGQPIGIPYTVVPDDQAMVNVVFDYADESDPGPYPIPADALIEGGPDSDGDRHVLIIRQGSCILYELFYAWPEGDGSWTAGSGAIWDLSLNEMRPEGWTSADAAGLAILPGLITYEEVYEQGEINHAVRFTLGNIQRGYIRPASHSDGRGDTDPTTPPMGQRFRLRADFDVSSFAAPLQVILQAFKTYGLVLADTGGDMFISGVPDSRWDDDLLHDLDVVTAGDFEAVYTGEIIPY